MSTRTLAWVIATMLAATLAVPASGQDRSEDEIAEDLERTGQEASDVEEGLALTTEEIRKAREELIAIQDRLADARGRLRQAEGQLALAEDGLAEAEENREVAEANLATALRLLEYAEQQLAREEEVLESQVVAAYKYGVAGRSDWVLQAVRQAQDPNDLVANIYKLRSVVAHQDDIVGRVLALRAEREELFQDAEESRNAAERAREEAAETLELVKHLRDEAAAIAAEVEKDETRQREVLAELERDAAASRQVLADLEAREESLRQEQEEARARRVSAGGGVCPVVGAKAGRDFSNDWGYPRPGGRSHEGTDIFADRGTPVVAMYSGTVKEIRRVDTGLGGLFVSYWVAPGEHWYNAHLDSIPLDLKVGDPVSPGQEIGTVGNSGNARGTPPHLHIGHYFNDQPENPYPILADACQ